MLLVVGSIESVRELTKEIDVLVRYWQRNARVMY